MYDKITDAYESFLTNVKQFQDINTLPTKLYFQWDCMKLQCKFLVLKINFLLAM